MDFEVATLLIITTMRRQKMSKFHHAKGPTTLSAEMVYVKAGRSNCIVIKIKLDNLISGYCYVKRNL